MSHFSISVLSLFGHLPLMAEEAPKTILVVNKGVGGQTSKDGLARFERDVIEVKPDHLILYFGINDACNSGKLVPVERFSQNMQTMIDRSPTRSIILVTPNPVMSDYLALRHPKHPFKTDFQSHLDKFDAAIRKLSKKNRIPIADLRKLVDENGGAAKTRGSLIRNEANRGGKDGVHLTADGYRLMAGLFEPLLTDRIKAGEIVVCLGDSITFGAHVRGAGTIAGETYPAWLSVILNRMIVQ
jgi:lysophospholipase L1-like esterase